MEITPPYIIAFYCGKKEFVPTPLHLFLFDRENKVCDWPDNVECNLPDIQRNFLPCNLPQTYKTSQSKQHFSLRNIALVSGLIFSE